MFFRPQQEPADYPLPDEVTESFHGKTVRDPFRWLEDPFAPEVQQWLSEQNGAQEQYFKATPFMSKLKARVIEITKMGSARYRAVAWAGEKIFAIKTEPPRPQPMLVVLPSEDDTADEQVVFDPNVSDPSGNLAIDWYVPSPDGKLVAISLSRQDTEVGDLHVFEVASPPVAAAPSGGQAPAPKPKQPVEGVIPQVHRSTAGGALAWTPDSKGFYYTRYPRGGERLDMEMPFFQEIYYHEVGTNSFKDKYELGKDLGKAAQFDIDVDPRSGRVIATAQQGDSGRFAHFLKEPGGEWQELTKFDDEVVNIVFSPRGGLYVLSFENALKGRLLYLSSPKIPVKKAKKLIATRKQSIVPQFQGGRTIVATKNRIYLTYQLGGPSEIRAFDYRGKATDGPAVPDLAAAGGELVYLGEDEVLFPVSSFTSPKAWYRFDGWSNTERTALSTNNPVDFSDSQVTRLTVKSKDGAQVPLHLVHRKVFKRNGRNPVILIGDGGFGRTLTPAFDPLARIWLDHGGIVAYAGIRGGGEYGEDWHRAGRLLFKQNSFDDFYACAKYLVSEKYTSTSKLALYGKENGGLLMGAMIIQHPLTMKAVVAHSGIFDVVRLNEAPNGVYMLPEYGFLQEEDQFKAMFAYSPYHRIKRRVDSPSVFFLNGVKDTTVAPFHTWKMAARLQEAKRSAAPVLVKTDPEMGHGNKAPFMAKLEERAEMLAFIFRELGVRFNAN
jgi:prolyl oligopeptidase